MLNEANPAADGKRGDKTNPNPSTTALIRAGDLADRATLFRNDLAFAVNPAFPKNPHTFLTNLVGNEYVKLTMRDSFADRLVAPTGIDRNGCS